MQRETVPFVEERIVTRADGTQVVEPAAHLCRPVERVADVWDRMASACARRRAALPFTPGQIEMGREYSRLHERWQAAGMRGTSLETLSGGGGQGSFIEAVLADGRRLELLRSRIGDGMAKEVRRKARGKTRRAISDRALVDAVCLGDMTIGQVLVAHGWDGSSGANVRALVAALAAALDRMQGPVRAPRGHVWLGQMPAAQGLGVEERS